MAVHSAKLAAGIVTLAASTPTTVYTAPSGHRTIVKELVVTRVSGAASTIYWIVDVGAVSPDVAHASAAAAPAGAVIVFVDRWFVMDAGDQLQLTVGGAGTFSYYVSGTELDL